MQYRMVSQYFNMIPQLPVLTFNAGPPRIVLTASVQHTVVNALKDTINVKSLYLGQKFWFKHQRHLGVKI